MRILHSKRDYLEIVLIGLLFAFGAGFGSLILNVLLEVFLI